MATAATGGSRSVEHRVAEHTGTVHGTHEASHARTRPWDESGLRPQHGLRFGRDLGVPLLRPSAVASRGRVRASSTAGNPPRGGCRTRPTLYVGLLTNKVRRQVDCT